MRLDRWATYVVLLGVAAILTISVVQTTASAEEPEIVTCDGLVATIVGTDGPDTLTGTSGRDVIAGLGGADTINARGGDDVICGGDGSDAIRGGGGADRVFGGDHGDRVRGGTGNDQLWGGGGRDRLHGGVGADVLFGGASSDSLIGVGGNDQLMGQHGADRIWGGSGEDVLVGGPGDDRMIGGKGDDLLLGGDDNDILDGGDGIDAGNGGAGQNRCVHNEQVVCDQPEPDPEPDPEPLPDPIPDPLYQLIDEPNIVLINLDDADVDLLDDWAIDAYFPNIARFIRDDGVRLQNFHSTAPLCGPSRGSLFRGQYPHNTGVDRNKLGWEIFYNRGYTDDEIGAWMQDEGYKTALVGKYCHEEYPTAARDRGFVPPGWDTFHASLGSKYYGTARNVQGQRLVEPVDRYRTDAERASVQTIVNSHDKSSPLFLYIAPFAPHGTNDVRGMVATRHTRAFPDVVVPRTPDYNEADVSDKTPQFASLAPFTAAEVDRWDERYRDRVRAMLAVDELIGQLFADLRSRDMLNSTYVILTSDNGYQLGHHRDLHKKDAFDRVTRVQAFVRGPGLPERVTWDHLIGHIDLVPTIIDLAGGEAAPYVDGKSFVPVLERGTALDSTGWQDAILIENKEGKVIRGVELDLDYVALRRHSDVYVEWANGDREYYDLTTDPFQLENRYSTLAAAEQAQLGFELDELRACAGAECHGGTASSPWPDTTLDLSLDEVVSRNGLTITGTASGFGDEVAAVEIVVRKVQGRLYWNGETFGPEYGTVAAQLNAGAGAEPIVWELDADIPAGDYWISARAIDEHGDRDPLIPTTFFSIR